MSSTRLPATKEIRQLFVQEIEGFGGSVLDAYDDGVDLFLRAVLARQASVQPRDEVNGGVALRTLGDEVLVHPYIFRQVCKNGAIAAQAIETRRVTLVDFAASSEAIDQVTRQLSEAICASASPEAFARGAKEMRAARHVEADLALHLMPYLSGLPTRQAAELVHQIVGEFEGQNDRSAFGLLNAVTAVARDTRDPDTRWRLEELEGGIPANVLPRRKPGPAHAELASLESTLF